jgi:hypothetical protein
MWTESEYCCRARGSILLPLFLASENWRGKTDDTSGLYGDFSRQRHDCGRS